MANKMISGFLRDDATLALVVSGGAGGAVDAASVTSTATGDVSATNVQAAIAELASEKQPTSAKGQANGYASLDGSTKVPTAQIPTITAAMVAADVATQAELDLVEVGDRPLWRPSDNNLLYASIDPGLGAGGTAPGAGVAHLVRIPLPKSGTVSTIHWAVFTAGATTANAILGLYSNTGTLIAKTADQSTPMNTTGTKSATLTAEAGQSLSLVSAGINDFIYGAFVIGSAGTMPQLFRGSSNFQNMGQVAADKFRVGTTGTGQTTLPASVTTTALTGGSGMYVLGLS